MWRWTNYRSNTQCLFRNLRCFQKQTLRPAKYLQKNWIFQSIQEYYFRKDVQYFLESNSFQSDWQTLSTFSKNAFNNFEKSSDKFAKSWLSTITQRLGIKIKQSTFFTYHQIFHFVHLLQTQEFLFRKASEEGKTQNRKIKFKIKLFVSFILWFLLF